MNTVLFSKTSLKTAVKSFASIGLLSLAASVSAYDKAEEPASMIQPITCANGKNYAEIFNEVQPFLDVDYDKAIAQLPEADARELQLIEVKLKQLEKQLEPQGEIPEEQDIEFLKLADKAAEIIERNNVKMEEVNRLDTLSESEREDAIALWCEIADKIEKQEQKEVEIDNMFIKLDNIILKEDAS